MPRLERSAGHLDECLSAFRRHRFAWLLALLLLTLAGAPLLEAVTGVEFVEYLLAITLLAAIAASADRRWPRWLIILGTAFVVIRLAHALIGGGVLIVLSQVLWIVVMLLAMTVMTRFAFKAGPVNSERLCAALDAYLVLGLVFGVAYWLLDQFWPDSFVLASGDFSLNRAVYFSFVTIATLGYGDIVPKSDAAGGIVVVEAVIGQFYLVVLVARLVSLYAKQTDAEYDKAGSHERGGTAAQGRDS